MPFIKSLDLELDAEHSGVPKHLGLIAESMDEWEGRIAEELGLTPADVAHIKTKHPSSLKLQTYDNVAGKIRDKIISITILSYRRAALKMWQQKLGTKATYRSLLIAFENAGYQGYAENIRKLVSDPISDQKTQSSSDNLFASLPPKPLPLLQQPVFPTVTDTVFLHQQGRTMRNKLDS